MDLVAFLRTWVGQMAEEQKKLEKSLADEDKALKKALKANHAKALKLAASHAAASEASTKAAALAHEVLNQGKEPEASDLSASEKAEIGVGFYGFVLWLQDPFSYALTSSESRMPSTTLFPFFGGVGSLTNPFKPKRAPF